MKEREGLLAKARGALAGDPGRLAAFDDLYEAARHSVPITEDHAFYIDQLGVGVFRRFVLVAGQRLVDNGLITEVDDVFFLRRDELGGLLLGGDRGGVVLDRRASFDAASP